MKNYGIVFRLHDGEMCFLEFGKITNGVITIEDAEDADYYDDFDYKTLSAVTNESDDGEVNLRFWFTMQLNADSTVHKFVADMIETPTKMSTFTDYVKQTIDKLEAGYKLPEEAYGNDMLNLSSPDETQ